MAQDHLFAEILHAFAQLEEWIPGCGTWPVDLMIGKLPDANPADIYRLADAWGAVAERLNTYYYDALHSADPISENWQGDGASMAFNQAWNTHLQDVGGVIQGMASMQMVVQSYGLQLETEEFFIAFTLIQLLIEAIVAIVSAIFSGGISLGGMGLAYAAARIAIKEAYEKCLQAILRLGEMIAEGELKRIIERTAVKDFLKTAGKDLVKHSGSALAKAPRALGHYVVDNLGPRRLLAKAAADRAASQFRKDVLRSVLRKELRKQLAEVGTKAEARAAVRALDRAAADLSQRIAADLSERLLAKWTGREAASLGRRELAHLGEHEAFNIAEHYGEHALAGSTRSMLESYVARELERTTMLGTAGRYVGQLAFAGAKFMGGVDFLAQGFELVTGERSSIDAGEVAFSLGQGALMGGMMFGHGVLGQMVTGGLAGVTTAAATDGSQWVIGQVTGQHTDINWGADLWRGAEDGVRMGVVFSAPHTLTGAASKLVPHFGDRPGNQVFALNDPRLGANVWTGDPRTGVGGYTSESGGLGWRLADGSFVHLGPDGSVIASHQAGHTDSGPVTHTRELDGPPTSTAVLDRPAADRAPGGGGDGGGPTRTRAVEGGSTRTNDRSLPSGREEPGADPPAHRIPEQRQPEPGTGSHEPGTGHQQADTGHQQADTDHQRAGTDHQQADTDHQRTDTDQQRAGTDHQQADTDHQRTDTDHQQVDGHGRPGSDHQQVDSAPRTEHTDTAEPRDPVRSQERPRTEIPADQVAVRQPQGDHGGPAGRTHAEEVLAAAGDRRAPEALRAEQGTHLGTAEAGHPTHSIDRVEQRLHDLAVEGREATTAEPHPGSRLPEPGAGGTHWVSAAGGRTADPHEFPRRLFADVLETRVPGGLAGADPHVVRARTHELAERVLATSGARDKVDTANRLREYVAAEMSVPDGAGRRLDPARVDRVADAAAGRARQERAPEHTDAHAPHDTRAEHDVRTEHQAGSEHDVRTEHEVRSEHEVRGEHDVQHEHDASVGHEPVPDGHQPVRIELAEPPSHEVHQFTRKFMQMSTDGSRRWLLVTEHVERHWTEATYERLPVEHMEGGADGPAAREAAHRAAHDLAQREYARLVETTDRWLAGDGRVEDLGKIGGMSAAAVLRDGRVVAATSVRERTTRVEVDSGHDDASWQRLNRDQRAEVSGEHAPTRRSALNAEEGLHLDQGTHPLVRQELAAITTGLRSQTHGRCAEPATLSRIAKMVDADLHREVAASGGEPRPGTPEYDRQLAERFRETVRDGYMASHRNEGEPLDRSEQLPCSTDDQLLNRLGMRSDYVDHAIATAHVDPQRRLVVLVEHGDPLRDYGMRLPDLGPDTVVAVMHGTVEGGAIGARIGDRDVTGVEVARVLNRIIDEHPQELGGRRIVLVTCEAGVDGMVRGRPTSLAIQVAERTGHTVVAATRDVLVSEHGAVRLEAEHFDNAFEEGRSRPREESSGWIEATPTHDRTGRVIGARAEPLPTDRVPFSGEQRTDGHHVRADEPARPGEHPREGDTTGTNTSLTRPEEPGAQAPGRRLSDWVRTRLGDLFGNGDAVDAHQAARDAAERAQYEASIRSAQQRVHATVEGDPRVRQLRQEARNAEFDRQHAEGQRADQRSIEANARNDARLAHEEAQRLRHEAQRTDPNDPRHQQLHEQASARQAEAAAHEARAAEADTRAGQAEQRIADAQRRIEQAGRSANEITRGLAGQRRGLWRWANVEAESQFRMVGPDHPGPQVSALTGRDVPPPVWSSRPYGAEGGLRQVLHVDQARLEQALSDGHGGYVRTPDPKGAWLRLLNAYGLHADPTRGQNCNDSVAALYDTFVHGRPTVAAPRTYDGYRNGNGAAPVFGERGGPGRMEDLTGGRYQSLVGNLTGQRTDQVVSKVGAGFDQIHQQLINGGHGSFASIVTGWQGGGSHAWAAVNHEGVVHFVDPQQAKVVIAEPHGGGLRFVDPATGHEVPHPIYDPAGIKAMDALVVDGQARPMPFGDRPPGTWNDRPMTAEYLDHQPPDVRSAQTAEASHRDLLAERNQAVSDANQARTARQDAVRQASEAQAHQTRAQDAARQVGIEQGQRDAAWDQANQQRALAARHDDAARYSTERLRQGGNPQEMHDAATRAQQHRAAADQARAHETRLRNEAYQHENVRQQAETAQRYWQNEATQAMQREVTATRAADWFEQQARVHEQQASQLESRYSQHAEQAASDHDQQATRYRQEAARYQQEAARHQTGDPRQESADRMRQHSERLAHSAERARDAYRTAHRHEESARQRDLLAEQHARQAEAWRRHAVDRDRLAAQHEQARAEEAARARARSERADELRRAADELTARGGAEDLARAAELRRQADEVDLAAQRHSAEAVARQQARDSATNEAGHARQVAQAHEAAAATERATATQHRQAVSNWQSSARSWHEHLRGTRAVDPSAEGGAAAPQFRPEDLRPDLRARYDALTDPKARAGFETKFREARGDQGRLARALEGMRAGAEARGHTLEHALVEHHERDLLKQAERAAIRPPDEDVAREIRTQLDRVEAVRTRIESYASRHPEVVGTDRWLRAVEHEATQLTRELRGENNPSVQKALDRGNNVRGVESEVALAERFSDVTEVGMPVTVKLADGTVLKTDVDVVADNGTRWIWRDSKDYHSFSVRSSDFEHARAQVIRQLRILLSGEYHRDGGPPRLEWHFPRGVDAEVARALEGIRVTDPRTGLQSQTHVYVVGERLGGGDPGEPMHAPAGGAEPPGAPGAHSGHPAPGSVEQARAHQIELSLQRVAGALGGSAEGDFVHHIEVHDDGLVTVTPREGRPFALRLHAEDIGADHFRVSQGPDGVRRVSISPELLDGRQGVRTDAAVARAIGHASGEVAAEGRSRRLGVLSRFGRQDALTTSVESGGHGKLSAGDLAKVGEFQELVRLREGISGPRRTEWVDREIGLFIERHGLRDGLPGADHRAELVGRHLSEPQRAALREYRAAWRDSDPPRALARHILAEGRLANAKLEPLGLGTAEFRDVYRVDPKGWARDSRLGFTVEIESGRPAKAGALAEITGTDLARHFRLVVDRDLLASVTGAEEAAGKLRDAIEEALSDRIGEQLKRPPEIPNWRVRLVDRTATLAGGGGGFGAAELLGAGTAAFKLAGGAIGDVLTAGYLSRHAALDAAEATHERALARNLQVSRMSGREVRAGTSEVRAEVESVADALGVPRSDLHWTPAKRATDPVMSTADVPQGADRTLRGLIGDTFGSLADGAKGVTAIKEPRLGRYLRVSVEHGADARVRLEVGNTPDRTKVEVVQDRRRFTLKVPPELLAADEPTLHKALTKAFEKVAAQQHEIATKVAHPAVHHAKNAAVDIAQALGQMPLQNLSSPHAGGASVAGTVLRKAGEVVASPLTGEHKAGQSVGGKSFDSDRTVKSVPETQLSNAATTARDAADNLTYLARAAEYRATHGTDADPATLALQHRTGDPMPAAYEAMTDVGQRHAGRVTLVDGDRSQDGAGARHLRYRLDVARGNRVRLDVTMHEGGTGDPRLVVKRTRWGRFEVEVHGSPEPDVVHKLVGEVAETIIDRRGAGLPVLSEYLRSKLLPVGVNGGTVMVIFAETHALPGLAIGGVAVTGGMLKGVGDYLHEMHLTDKAVEQKFAKHDVNEVYTGDLRTAYARTGTEVERFESRVADQLRQRLTELEHAHRQPDLTAARHTELDERSSQVHQRLDSLPAPDATVLTPLHDSLPRLDLPRNGEVRLVSAEHHVFVVSFDRGGLSLGGRPRESLAFDVITGDTGGEPARVIRTNSDTALTVVVDAHAAPAQIQQQIGGILRGLSDTSHLTPLGRPGSASQLVGLGKDATSAASQLGGAAAADMAKFAGSFVANLTTGGGTIAGGLARIVADSGLAENKAQRSFARDLSENLRSGKPSAHHLGVFTNRSGHWAVRLRTAQEILDWLGSWRA
ncbi:toxin glutamine deamidase domain-containing protein [Dactylosporangium sp. NPDC048998]|uniref:toxin glutamine deamidase domain-containing protein n=1 Tax=Dactylosporangium sp. NPDC048998 TaxID=3363976 RepID=UPI00371CFEC4